MNENARVVIEEADVFSQNVAELLREYAEADAWAADLLAQAEALRENTQRILGDL